MPQVNQNNLSKVLTNINTGVSIATTVSGVLTPVISGIVKGVSQVDSQTFQVTISLGNQNLDEAHQNFSDSLAAINAERAAANPPLPPIVVSE
jgi:hypothetical protein